VVPGFGAKANITVTIDLQDLKAATADAIGVTVYSSGLSAATIRRLACDANVIPVVLGSNSEPLDVGRRERLVTRAMRRALNTRDGGCVVCGAPPIMCDAHHLTSWIDGGDTKIGNLALLCRRHHTDLHNGHWNISITDGRVQVARPAWADPPTAHRYRPAQRAPRPRPESGPVPPTGASPTAPAGVEPDISPPHRPPRTSTAASLRPALGRQALQRLRETTGREEFTDAELRAAVAIEAWGEEPVPPAVRLIPDNRVDRAADQRGRPAAPSRVA
jgi:hypothetical protein